MSRRGAAIGALALAASVAPGNAMLARTAFHKGPRVCNRSAPSDRFAETQKNGRQVSSIYAPAKSCWNRFVMNRVEVMDA